MLTKGFLAFGNLLKNTTKEHPNGIQEVSGSIPLISTTKHSISLEIECLSILFSLFCAGRFRLGQQMDNRPSQFLLSYCGKEYYIKFLYCIKARTPNERKIKKGWRDIRLRMDKPDTKTR